MRSFHANESRLSQAFTLTRRRRNGSAPGPFRPSSVVKANPVAGGGGERVLAGAVAAVRIGERNGVDAELPGQVVARAPELLLGDRVGELGELCVRPAVRAEHDAGLGEIGELLPARDLLAVEPARRAPDRGGGHEQERPDAGVAPERLDDVPERVVRRDDDAPAREGRPAGRVALDQPLDRQRPHPQQPEHAHLAVERPRCDVEPLLARLQLAGQAVVEQRRVPAPQPPPLGSRRRRADAAPEGGAGGDREQIAARRDERMGSAAEERAAGAGADRLLTSGR